MTRHKVTDLWQGVAELMEYLRRSILWTPIITPNWGNTGGPKHPCFIGIPTKSSITSNSKLRNSLAKSSITSDSNCQLIWRDVGTKFYPTNTRKRNHYSCPSVFAWGGIMMRKMTKHCILDDEGYYWKLILLVSYLSPRKSLSRYQWRRLRFYGQHQDTSGFYFWRTVRTK